MIPLIGVSTYVADARWGSWERRAAVLPESYFELVAAAGGRPVLLPPPARGLGGPESGADEVVAVLDGLVLTGGGDVDPLAYGEEPVPEVSGVDPTRDASERALLEAALRADLPILAICRGCQVLNVELGGTLHQHLPDVVGHLAHRNAPYMFGDVDVETVPGSLAAGVFGASPTVRCSHHQAIRELGRGLVATAATPDGVVEAVELPSARFVLAVQWHPEEDWDQRPFDALVKAAEAYRSVRSVRERVTPQVRGRVAVITGASRGLGAGLAVHLAGAGMHLGLCARHRPALVARTRPVAHEGHVVAAEAPVRAAVDVTDAGALERFASAVVDVFGRIDLWINNAGLLGPVGPLADADPAEVARTVGVDVTGVANGTAVFARHVRSRPGDGVLVNMSSGAATKPYEGWAAYCASKAAVDQLTRVVALEEARHGLRAYAVSPGLVDTDMQVAIRATDEASFPEVDRFRRAAREHRFNSPTWVAEHILTLAFGPEPPEAVVLRIPDQPVPGLAG